jgi:hypothetical protein
MRFKISTRSFSPPFFKGLEVVIGSNGSYEAEFYLPIWIQYDRGSYINGYAAWEILFHCPLYLTRYRDGFYPQNLLPAWKEPIKRPYSCLNKDGDDLEVEDLGIPF